MFARSTMMGNARASESGTSNKYDSHAFLFYSQIAIEERTLAFVD